MLSIFLADSCHGGGMVKGADPRAGRLRVRGISRAVSIDQVAPGVFWRDPALDAQAQGKQIPVTGEDKWAFDQTAMQALPHLTFIAGVDAKSKVTEALIPGEATSRGAASFALARALAGAADAAGNADGVTTRHELVAYVRHYVRYLTLDRQAPMIEPGGEAVADVPLFEIVPDEDDELTKPAPAVEAAAATPSLPAPHASAPKPAGPKTAAKSVASPPKAAASVPKPAAEDTARQYPTRTDATPISPHALTEITGQLMHDARTGDVITPSGDVLAYGVPDAELTPVVERIVAFNHLARLAASRPLDLTVTPEQAIFADRDKFRVSVNHIDGQFLLIADLSGNGQLSYMFPQGNADPLMEHARLDLPFTAGRPFGADTLLVVASRERPTALELELSLQLGKNEPLAVADAFERLLPPGARLGLLTFQTRPTAPADK